MRQYRYKQDEQRPNVVLPSPPLSGKVAKTCASDPEDMKCPVPGARARQSLKGL